MVGLCVPGDVRDTETAPVWPLVRGAVEGDIGPVVAGQGETGVPGGSTSMHRQGIAREQGGLHIHFQGIKFEEALNHFWVKIWGSAYFLLH